MSELDRNRRNARANQRALRQLAQAHEQEFRSYLEEQKRLEGIKRLAPRKVDDLVREAMTG
jgi:hypothetical protein